MSKYKYFLKVLHGYAILEENTGEEWKNDISCVLWNIFDYELGDSGYLSVCVGFRFADHGMRIYETGKCGVFGKLAGRELEDVGTFLRKNIQVIKAIPEAQKHRLTVKTETRTEWDYIDKETYQELERLAESGITKDEYQKKLQKAYEQNRISLAEMRRLLQTFRK